MTEFITSPNQRRVSIHKCDQPSGYTKIDRTVNRAAMKALSYSAYMLYMIFCTNATGFEMILSPVAIMAETGFSRNTYYDAFNELVDKGYLVCKPGTKCLFDFYEDPKRERVVETTIPKKGKAHAKKQDKAYQKTEENILNIKKTRDRRSSEDLPAIPTEKKKTIFIDL